MCCNNVVVVPYAWKHKYRVGETCVLPIVQLITQPYPKRIEEITLLLELVLYIRHMSYKSILETFAI